MDAIKSFFDQFEGPNDIYKEIFLTVLFEELLGEKNDLLISDPQRPEKR